MTSSVALAAVVAGLVALGFVLLTSRSLGRITVGFVVLGHAANLLLLLAGGPALAPPVIGESEPSRMADPLVQAFALTAIVITFGVTLLLLAMVHRSWAIRGSDQLPDDPEDRRLADVEHRAEHGEVSESWGYSTENRSPGERSEP
ncbi:MAG: sodium:proton antiporter [Pseudonocardiaceae bacterium]|nr:sodium:proton antiporter [Pseudonocardiaceae bacterium]